MHIIENSQERRRRWKLSLLEIIRSRPGISRTELKQVSGLSMESVLKLVEEMLAEHLIIGCGMRETGKAGRKASGLRIDPEGGYFIGVRFSAAEIFCVCTDFDHFLLSQWSRELPPESSTTQILDMIAEGISFLLSGLGEKRAFVKGIGIGAPGLIDLKNGMIRRYVHVPGCQDWPLRDLLQKRFGLPVYLEHGVKCSAAAFFQKQGANAIRDALFVQVGRGVNMCVLSEGRILHGSSYMSGEIGHMPLRLSPYQCHCGRIGCLETVTGNDALDALAHKALSESGHGFPVLRRLLSEGLSLHSASIIRAAEAGDPDCIHLLEQAGSALGTALAAAVMLVNPSTIIICSKLDRCRYFTDACDKALHADTFSESMENTMLRFLPSDPSADAQGAARLPYRALFEI